MSGFRVREAVADTGVRADEAWGGTIVAGLRAELLIVPAAAGWRSARLFEFHSSDALDPPAVVAVTLQTDG